MMCKRTEMNVDHETVRMAVQQYINRCLLNGRDHQYVETVYESYSGKGFKVTMEKESDRELRLAKLAKRKTKTKTGGKNGR